MTDIVDTRAISWRFIKVWTRNLVTFRRIWKVNLITPLLEPLLFIAAFGLGFAGLLSTIRYAQVEISYTIFTMVLLIVRRSLSPKVAVGEPESRHYPSVFSARIGNHALSAGSGIAGIPIQSLDVHTYRRHCSIRSEERNPPNAFFD